ncbi:MAG TPA: phage tail protein [Kofleriaceae bacterium]|jgi:phage tail-like protein
MPPVTNPNRTYSAAHFVLALDGADAGLLRSIEGGNARTDVMTYNINGGPAPTVRWRQLGKPKFEDIKIQAGMAASKPFFDWIADFMAGKATRHDGAIIAGDFYYKERARREFTAALIKEFTFPKLDANDKSPAFLTVALTVENVKFSTTTQGSGATVLDQKRMESQKAWKSCNFRFTLSGFEDSVRRVVKVDSFTVKQNIVEYHQGGILAPTKTPTTIDTPNLTFYVPEADAQPFIDHFTNDNAIAIKNDVKNKSALHGSITAIDNALKDVFEVSFLGCDIFSITPDRSDSTTEEIKLVKIELYVESMAFKWIQNPSPTTA